MEIANTVVRLILGLQTPFAIVAIIGGMWSSSRMRANDYGRKTRLLVWATFIGSVLCCIGNFGQVILLIKMGYAGNSLISLLFGAFWAYWSYTTYRTLRKIGAL